MDGWVGGRKTVLKIVQSNKKMVETQSLITFFKQ
jgi:hypothetical protein